MFFLFVLTLIIVESDFLVGIELTQVVAFDVVPVIVGRTVCRNGQTGFLSVQQYLDEDVVVGLVLTIVNYLYAGTEGGYTIVGPSLLFQLVEVGRLQSVVVELHEADEFQHHASAAVAQVYYGMVQFLNAVTLMQ